MKGAANRVLGEGTGLPMTPMIDIVLLLLIFFMLISRYLPPSLNVTLPQAASAAVDERPSVALSIDADGTLAVDGEVAAWESLPALLDGRDAQTQVRIAADRAADYEFVVRALDASGTAGLQNIALETDAGAAAIETEAVVEAEAAVVLP